MDNHNRVQVQNKNHGLLARPAVRKVAKSLLSSAALWCLAGPALAQTVVADLAPETVVVTGTSIRGVAPVGSDLISVNRDSIIATGAATTADLLTKIPQISSFNSLPRPGLSASVGVGMAPGLRGLNSTATLILMDGQRLVADNPLKTNPDPSSIPAAAIERVEILADGSSAVYGSDAVAGVINIITRRNLEGAETSIRGEDAQHGYHGDDLSQAFGHTWSGGSAMLVLGYNENTHLANYQLPFYTENLIPFGGIDLRSTNCAPPNLTVGGVTYTPPNYAPGAAVHCNSSNSDTLPDYRRTSVLANGHQQITDDLSVFADAKYTATFARSLTSPGGTNVTLTTANPYFKLPTGATGTSEVLNYNVAGIVTGPIYNRAFSKTADIIVGADYSLPWDWKVTATANYGVGDNAAHQPTFDAGALAAAAAGTTAATALDPFGNNTSPTVRAAVANFENLFTSHQVLQDYQVKADGPLWSLPGGDMKVAVGFDYRDYGYHATNSVGAIGQNQGLAVVSADRGVWALFGEIQVPLVGSANAMPLIQSLTFSAAARYDDYSDFGSTVNPKFGVNWSPVQDLMFRANYGTSFHAPDMGDSYAVDTRALYFTNFPLVPPGSPPLDTIALAGGNPGLQPEKADTWSVGWDYTPGWLSGLRASVTYWNIVYTGQIQTGPISQALFTNPAYTFLVTANPTSAQLHAIACCFRLVGTTLDSSGNLPAGIKQIIDLRRNNLSATHTDGIDLDISYGWDTDFGRFTADAAGTRTLDLNLQSAAGSPFVPQTTSIRTSGRASLGWVSGPMSANVAVNISGEFKQPFTLPSGTSVTQTVSPFTTVDLHGAYDLGLEGLLSDITVSVDFENLLDEDPPLQMVGGGYSGFASPLGRVTWLGIHKNW